MQNDKKMRKIIIKIHSPRRKNARNSSDSHREDSYELNEATWVEMKKISVK
jgi:hypothetical protein